MMPYWIYEFVARFYAENARGNSNICVPETIIHVAILSGIFFTVLNYYWGTLIIKKLAKKIGGKSKKEK